MRASSESWFVAIASSLLGRLKSEFSQTRGENPMRGTRQSKGQIITIQKQHEEGLKTAELCRQQGNREARPTTARGKVEKEGIDGGIDGGDGEEVEAVGRTGQEAQARGGRVDTG